MRRILACIALLLVAAMVVSAQTAPGTDKKSQGVGRWTLDKAKSDFGKTPPPRRASLHVTESSADRISYTYTEVDAKGKTYKDSWSGKPDGSMRPSETVPPGSSQASFRWEGDTLMAEFKDDKGMEAQERITFSEDGRTMNVERTAKGPEGESKSTQVWRKKGAAKGKPAAKGE